MASPQVENGYTRIANELFDAILCADLGKRQAKVLWAVIRLTYGFNKKDDAITFFQLARMTGMDRAHAGRAVKELSGRNILTVAPTGRQIKGQPIHRIGVNKNYGSWDTVANSATESVAEAATVADSAALPNQQQDCCQIGTQTVAKTAHSKDRKTGKTGSARAKQVPKPEGVSDEVWRDFLQHRKTAKAALTENAWRPMEKHMEALVAEGWTPDEVLQECMAAGWRAFKADWIRNRCGMGPEARKQKGESIGTVDY